MDGGEVRDDFGVGVVVEVNHATMASVARSADEGCFLQAWSAAASLAILLLTSNRRPRLIPSMSLHDRTDLLQGTLDLLVLKTLATLGPLHGFGIARRIEQVSGDAVLLNQGTIYPALVRLEDQGWIVSEWGISENNRRARFYTLTANGRKQLREEVANWQRVAAMVNAVLATD